MPVSLLEHNDGRSRDVILLDIRLENDVIVLRGPPEEASGALLKGTLTLCLQHHLTIRRMRLELVGVQRIQWHEPTRGKTLKEEEVIYKKEWQFLTEELAKMKTYTLEAGNHEYPFEVVLPGNQAESVEGLRDANIVYRMKATIERPKYWKRPITAKKHLRIVRTLSPGSLELSSTMSIENTWANKCDYILSIPHKACVYGTQIPLDISILPLLKGLTVGTVTCYLEEYHTFHIPGRNKKKTDQKVISTLFFNHGGFEGAEDGEGGHTGRWGMHAQVDLPKNLAKCVQDCEVGYIKIRHKLRIAILLINPDGHKSELRASLPVQLFISPNLLMGEDNEIHGDQPCDASTLHAAATPPTYDEHIYDRLWDGLPIETFFSPFASGANTPAFVSRNNSMENILLTPPDNYLLDSAASSRPRTRANSPGGTSTGPSSPDELSADELHASLGTSRCSSDYFSMSGRRAGTRSAGNTRPGSSEGSSANNTALADVAKLSRVPSYNTAVRVGPRSLAAHNSLPQLPQYESGSRSVPNSAPSSPPLGPGSSSRPVTPTNRIGRGRLGFSLRSGMTRHTSPPAASAGAPAVTDLERRIKLLQARERN